MPNAQRTRTDNVQVVVMNGAIGLSEDDLVFGRLAVEDRLRTSKRSDLVSKFSDITGSRDVRDSEEDDIPCSGS